jgi:hypothetical protein
MMSPARAASGAVLAGWLVSACGIVPSHLHHADSAATARKAQAEFSAYEEQASGIYDAMVTNLEAFRREQDSVLEEFVRNSERTTLALTIDQLTADTLKDKRLTGLVSSIKGVDGALSAKVDAYYKQKTQAATDRAAAQAAIETAEKAIERAEAQAEQWEKAVALLKRGIAAVPVASAAAGGPRPSGEVVVEKIKAVADEKVEYRDARGNVKSDTIGNILKSGVTAATADTDTLKALGDVPGIEVTILTIGLDLAEINKKASGARLHQLTRRMDLYQDTFSALRLAEALTKDLNYDTTWAAPLRRYALENALTLRAQLTSAENEKDKAKRGRLFDEYQEGTKSLAATLGAVRRVVVSEVIVKRADEMLRLGDARLTHEDSIIESRVADEGWRVIVRNGLAGLVAFHDGGFTAEDAANIIRIAQAIALAFIAGGVQ